MFKRILVVLEFEAADSAALSQALALGKAHEAEVVIYAAPPAEPIPVAEVAMVHFDIPADSMQEAVDKVQGDLAAAQALVEAAGVRSRIVAGEPGTVEASHIVERARELQCDLIVVESTGRNSVVRLLDGSVIPGLITRSTIPILIARHGTHDDLHADAAPAADGGRAAHQRATP